MAVRVRADGRVVCAAMHDAEPGDTYLHDGLSYLLSVDLRVLVTEPMELPEGVGRGGHARHGEWWWSSEIPDDVEIDSFYGGEEVTFDDGASWRWAQTASDEEMAEVHRLREASPCWRCGQRRINGVADPCHGPMPGVVHSCCGHGFEMFAYVIVAPGFDAEVPIGEIPPGRRVEYRGTFAVEIFRYLTAPRRDG